jgi:hypothetical protein
MDASPCCYHSLCVQIYRTKLTLTPGIPPLRLMYTSSRLFRGLQTQQQLLTLRDGIDTSSLTKASSVRFLVPQRPARHSPRPRRRPLLPKKMRTRSIYLDRMRKRTRKLSGSRLSVSRSMPQRRLTNQRRSPRSVPLYSCLSLN